MSNHEYCMIPENIVLSDAFNDLNSPSIKMLSYLLLSEDRYRISIFYPTFKAEPFNMANTTISRSITSLMHHGFVEMLRYSSRSGKTEYQLSTMFINWKFGDIIFTKEKALKDSPSHGHVYVVMKESGLVKIGITTTPNKRILELQNMGGEIFIKRWVSEKCKSYHYTEGLAHETFERYRSIGEWFNIPFSEAVKFCEKSIKDHV
ncbi:MAG: GIY-YIG nuclease family protein [Planctomycetes bacterium]|nr:GIY-YIG nuclease family protein [Planctomycetota bacterium]